MAASKTDFVNVSRASWAPRGGLGAALMAPRLSVEPPLEIVSTRVRLAVFSVPGGTRPKTQFHRKYTYLQWFLIIFRRTGARKWAPPGPPLILQRPPPGGQKSPRKSARGPPGPIRRPRDLVKDPRDPARSPPGGPGGARGDPSDFATRPHKYWGFSRNVAVAPVSSWFFFLKT